MSRDSASPRVRLAQLVDWERRDREAGMRVDVGPARDLLARLGDPHRRAQTVHVAGSKGKGSLCAVLDAALRRAGARTARYTSPHVEALEERTVVAGEPLAPAQLDAALERALAAREAALAAASPGAAATWFDVVTAAAFEAFAAAGAQWWVVECGLGGRLDSTNVLHAPLCAITSIELEHTAVLGTTRAAIAAEKAGILHPGCGAVVALPEPASGDEAARAVADHAGRVGAQVRFRPPQGEAPLRQRTLDLAAQVLTLAGERGLRATAGGALLGPHLLVDLDPAAYHLPGRLERFQWPGATVVLDGAHTAESLDLALRDLGRELPGAPVLVLALGRDKPAPRLLKALVGRVDRALCCAADPARQFAPETLADLARAAGLAAEAAADPTAALHRALSLAVGRWVLVVGSLHLVGAVRADCRRRALAGNRC
jgi:dihydrofolate synthase/folylpolyglutamate synthase